MKIFVLGISHKTAPIDLREKLAINDRNYDSFSQVVGNHGMIYELTPLSTCHRTEFYGVTRDEEYAKKKVLEGLSAMADLSLDQFEDKCYFKTQNDAVHHLFRVTSGLDSMVIGENEILGQVKNAYNRAF
ncbi:glutamyl-tRNA reductase, partial [PVC group bacterium]|nr:glutamyl-tRNA reductase [PVC group bacterium]